MSAPNTRESKLTRLLKRQAEDSALLEDIAATQRLDHQVRALNNSTMKAQSDTIRRLLRQHDTLRQMPSWPLVERELIAANALVAKPMKGYIPTTANINFTITPHTNVSPFSQHAFDDKGRRCTRCHCLKDALEASGEGCVIGTPL